MKTRHFVSMALAAALLFSVAETAAMETVSFRGGKQYEKEITYLSRLGVIRGYPDRTFHPNDPVKRIQAVQLIVRAGHRVVMIGVYDENKELIFQGSRFVTTSGLIVANYHVINGGSSFGVETHTEDMYELEGVVAYDLQIFDPAADSSL